MSTPPPPAPPPPPYPPASAASAGRRAARQAARDQRRAAALVQRQQQALLKQQMRLSQRSSLLGPLLLIGCGVFFLTAELAHMPASLLVLWLARWWPALLVGAGVVLVAEWGFDHYAGEAATSPLPRRSVGPGTVLILLLLVAAGVGARALQHHPAGLIENWNPALMENLGLDQVFAAHSDVQQELSAALPKGGVLSIENFRGNITVSGTSADGQVHVSSRQQLWAWQGSELQSKRERYKPVLVSSGTGLLLKAGGDSRDQTELTVEVPHESSINIAAEKGEITANEIRGSFTVEEHRGGVTLTALTGPVHLSLRDDGATVSAHSVSGDFTLDGRSGDLNLSDLAGAVRLQGDFFGTTHLERVTGPLHFQTSFTSLSCNGISGELEVEGRSELHGRDLTGPVVLSTTDRNIELSDVRGGASISDRNGSLTLTLADPLGAVDANTTDGSIDVSLDKAKAFTLRAETADGDITNELGLAVQKNDDRATLTGQSKPGGPVISLKTSNGDINLRHRSGEPVQRNAERAPGRSTEPAESGERSDRRRS